MSDQDAGTLLIGAKIDTGVLTSDLQLTKEDIATFVESVNVEFSEMSTRTASAMARIGEDTKEAAATISAEWQRAAAASYEFAAAQREVRAATTLVSSTEGEDAAAVQILAAAKERAALAAKELATAQKAAAAASEESAGIEIASAEEIKAAFSGMAAAIGATFAFEFLQKTKESVLELSHLSEATGVSVSELAQLRASMTESGVSADNVAQFMARLSKNMVSAAEGSTKQATAFKDLGVNTEDWHGKLPPLDSVLMQIADHLHQTGGGAQNLGEGFSILGRNSVGLIAYLSQGSEAIRQQMGEYSELGDEIEKSERAAKELQSTEAQLSAAWQTEMLPVFRALVEAIRWFSAEVIVSKAELENFGRGLELVSTIMDEGVRGMIEQTKALAHLDWTGASNAAKETANRIKTDWSLAMLDMDQTTEKAVQDAAKFLKDAPSGGTTKSAEPAELSGKDQRLQEWRLELDQRRDAEDAFHELSKADEAAFWQSKLAIARGTPKLYAEVYHQFAEADRAAKQQSLKDEVQAVETSVQQYRQGSQERVVILQEEVNHLHAMGADQTAEYKRLQQQLTVAQREAADQQLAIQVRDEETKVKATKDGTLAREKAEAEYVELVKKLYGADSTQYAAALEQQAQAHQKFIEQQKKMDADAIEFREQGALLELDGQKQAFDQEVALGLKSRSEMLQQELSFAAQEHAIREKALNEQIALLSSDPDTNAAQLAKLHQQVLAEDQKYENQRLQIDRKYVTERMQLEQGLQNSLRSGFSSAITGMITGTQTLAQSMRQLFSSIVNVFASMLADMLTRWIAANLLMKVFGIEQTSETNVARASSDAAVAAGGTFAWWSGVNPLVAPAMAAAAFGEGMTWAALAGAAGTASQGALLDKDMPIFAHAKEMILPANLSEGIQKMISFGGFRMPSFGPATAAAAVGGGSAGDTTIHNHVNYNGGDVSAIDGRGIGAALKNSRSEVVKTLQKFVRSGHMSPRKLGFRS